MDILTMVRRKMVARRIAQELRSLDDRTLNDVGIPRETILRIPKTEGPRPLVIVLHGWTASGAMAEQYTGMAEEGERRGYVTMFPDGLGKAKGWNAGFIDLTGQKPDDIALRGAFLKAKSEEEIEF